MRMKFNRLNIIMLLGLVAIAGILIIQLYLLKQAVKQEENKFDQKARLALLEVAKRLYQDNKLELPELNPVKEVSEESRYCLFFIMVMDRIFYRDVFRIGDLLLFCFQTTATKKIFRIAARFYQ